MSDLRGYRDSCGAFAHPFGPLDPWSLLGLVLASTLVAGVLWLLLRS